MKTGSSRSPARYSPAARGFTLVELMIVLVIMSVVIAFAGPRVAGGLLGLSLRSAALQTAAMLRYARSRAANTGCRYHVVFDGIERRVILLQAKPAGASGNPSAGMGLDPGLSGPAARAPEQDFDDVGDAASAGSEQKLYKLPEGVFFEKVIIADIDGAGPGDDMAMMLTFSPNGTSRGASLAIADEHERRYFVTVDALSGSVRVDEESGDE